MFHLWEAMLSKKAVGMANGSNSQGDRVVRRCWVNSQCQGILLIWIIIGQGPIALEVGAGTGGLDIFSLIYLYSFFLPLWETARYRLKYCLKGALKPKQPTIHPTSSSVYSKILIAAEQHQDMIMLNRKRTILI